MNGSSPLCAGRVLTWERVFSKDDVRSFAHLSGDQGEQHVRHKADGHVMVHGLLTATLPTKIGGDLNFIAREIEFVFPRPVFTGDRIRCEVTIVSIAEVLHSAPDTASG
jgi:3-hydroxybutyryl-CoA dehydratase